MMLKRGTSALTNYRNTNLNQKVRAFFKPLQHGLMAVSLVLVGCSSETTTENEDPNNVRLEQGWDLETTQKIHHTTFGSRLIPLAWMQALEISTPSGKNVKLLSSANLEKLGFILSSKSKVNPHGLPVGMTVDTDSHKVDWVGLGCAACHTGEVIYQGKKIQLEGGQSLLNFSLFESQVADALSSVLTDPMAFERFQSKLINNPLDEPALKLAMRSRLDYIKNRQSINQTNVAYGHGRLDAFGQIFNTVGVELLKIPENKISPDAPVSYPVLWNASHLDLVQWNGSAPNEGPGPLFQNVTTAIAVYGQMEVVNNQAKMGYKSSVNIPNLKHIQNWLYQLESPQWPEEILGKLDVAKVEKGEKIYQKACLQCHELVDRNNKKNKLKAVLTNVDEVGTDPKMVENFLNAKMKSGMFEGDKVLFIAGDKIQATDKSINLVAHAAAGAALNHPLQTIDAIVEDYHSVYKASIDANPNYYKARPLTGIWGSAPYLHNGSVLTLAELLSPVESRRKSFWVGDRNLDVERVGLVSTKSDSNSYYDTRRPGNSNAGHLYGADLSQDEKLNLLEYLKSL